MPFVRQATRKSAKPPAKTPKSDEKPEIGIKRQPIREQLHPRLIIWKAGEKTGWRKRLAHLPQFVGNQRQIADNLADFAD